MNAEARTRLVKWGAIILLLPVWTLVKAYNLVIPNVALAASLCAVYLALSAALLYTLRPASIVNHFVCLLLLPAYLSLLVRNPPLAIPITGLFTLVFTTKRPLWLKIPFRFVGGCMALLLFFIEPFMIGSFFIPKTEIARVCGSDKSLALLGTYADLGATGSSQAFFLEKELLGSVVYLRKPIMSDKYATSAGWINDHTVQIGENRYTNLK